jgi:hypothetical protein
MPGPGYVLLLDGDVPLTDRAHPYVFLRKRDERHPADTMVKICHKRHDDTRLMWPLNLPDLEPGSRLSAGDGSWD